MKRMLIAALAVAAVAVPGAALATPGHEPVTICHMTGSEKNPFVVITVDSDATKQGHLDGVEGHHQDGDVFGGLDCEKKGGGGGEDPKGGEF